VNQKRLRNTALSIWERKERGKKDSKEERKIKGKIKRKKE